MQRRREFIQTGVAAVGSVALGAEFWREALAATVRPGPGLYGPLGPPNEHGLRLPSGFRSRLVARANLPVAGTTHPWHIFPDGQATYPTRDGGWILVSNCEAPAFIGGGAAAIRFDRDGRIRDAYRILSDTNVNCAGGATPWGTWLSCEEVDQGRVWECDPSGRRAAVVRPAMGVFKHEAAAVDPRRRRVYLTEDIGDGGFYRFTPKRWPSLAEGTLEIASVAPDGKVTWHPVPDPAATTTPTRQQVPETTPFARGEGIWFDSGVVYVATTGDNRVHAYHTRREWIEVIYDAAALTDPPLTGVDNMTVSRNGDLYVCEDNGTGELDIVVVTRGRRIARFLTATGLSHRTSELCGVIFNPGGGRLYFSSQRFDGTGAVFEVSGLFRGRSR
ncbi:MAG TPA: alkaline phosphatase PhoX [Thermoleophilaceae bacterium]|nr:alkaline phosphatase PhoX [Thermoleophilaceae bacterium]